MPDLREARAFPADARLLLVFTPELCTKGQELARLRSVFDVVDLVQVRPKAAGAGPGPAEARAALDWTRRVLDLRRELGLATPVLVDDRVDVAERLAEEGCDGVHLGQDDCPVEVARRRLGRAAWIGWSTHSLDQVVESEEFDVDYLGFGPVHATATKGYERGLGTELAWIAAQSTARPVFPIGGIGLENAHELERVGRAAVASAILAAPDPRRAALELRAALAADPSALGAGDDEPRLTGRGSGAARRRS